MHTILLVIHIVVAISLVVFVLLQQGKGADVGAAFGSGASQTMFGSRGAASFLTRATAVLATLFFVTSLSLAYLSGQIKETTSVTERFGTELPAAPMELPPAPADEEEDVPAVPKVVGE